MHTTRLSLIQQLGERNANAWAELDHVYRPLLRCWLRRFPLQPDDVEDVVQEVLAVLLRSIAEFEHNGRTGAFRNWLRTTTANLARNHLRRRNQLPGTGTDATQLQLAELADPASQISRQFDAEHDRAVVRALLERMAKQFEPITLEMFKLHVIEGLSVSDTAARLGVRVASVHTAKSRVLRRLREEAAGWIDDSYLV